ncbi:MAG: dihydrofolate reductase family protein [Gemmatimonadaceae bacterium]
MRKLIWQMMVSLDGFMEGPNRELDWHVTDGDFNRYVTEVLTSTDAILLGRVTYQLFADYWPSSTDSEAPMMNDLPKIVFSRTLEQARWKNSRVVKENIEAEIDALKRQAGKDLALFGSADLASTFMRLGLIDEYRILVNPVVLGSGRPMFRGIEDRAHLTLSTTRTLSSGVVILSYHPGPGSMPTHREDRRD